MPRPRRPPRSWLCWSQGSSHRSAEGNLLRRGEPPTTYEHHQHHRTDAEPDKPERMRPLNGYERATDEHERADHRVEPVGSAALEHRLVPGLEGGTSSVGHPKDHHAPNDETDESNGKSYGHQRSGPSLIAGDGEASAAEEEEKPGDADAEQKSALVR